MERVMKKRTFSGTKSTEISSRERRGQEIARKAAAEGMVLLKNDGILPLDKNQSLALLGAGAGKTIKGGTGSGDVCVRHSVSVYEGMEAAGFRITSADWIADYEQRYQKAREDWKQLILQSAGGAGTPDFFNAYASHAFVFPEGREITEEDFQGSSVAVYVISRIAGEGADRKNAAGDYEMSDREIQDLKTISDMGKEIVVLLNIGGLMDLKPVLENSAVKAVLYISQPGMAGGEAVADILSGAVNPSGKLTDSWAYSYSDYPNADSFSFNSGDITREEYKEGIYVGYRYFDTYEIPVQYCFGYGLSYTQFTIEPASAPMSEESGITMSFQVTNTGKRAGKEVVQLYAALPEGGLSKEYRRLVGFKKTGLLKEGEQETVEIQLDAKQLASFDAERGCWILEAGNYYLMAGNSLESSVLCGCLKLQEEQILETTEHICPMQEELQELTGKEERRAQRLQQLSDLCREKGIQPVIWKPEPENTADPQEDPVYRAAMADAKELAEKLTEEELIYLSVGEISRGHDVALGAAGIMVPGAAGESSGILEEKYGVPGVAMADGPAGIRVITTYLADETIGTVYTQGFLAAIEQGFFAAPLEKKEGCEIYYQYCTAIPVGIMMAQTWNPELQMEAGHQVGLEMDELGLSWWLAPGLNIHRNPLCGRNFEYFSEDPYVSGVTAAAITKGVQSVPGAGTTIKHFCCNNQEDNRMGSNSILSERALREIYLRGFEIAVKTSQPMAVMSSYNLVNGVHTANSRDLLMTVLRREWGYKGFVMTDWTTTTNGSLAHLCVKNGNELIMPGCPEDLAEIRAALADGRLTRKELEESAARMLTVIFQTNAYE
ncbi:MAG: glycoside hydrolase family 3 C-terminal domain-containing protein [Lachnospiraceae bacterium]|nr:glycoside hydrolase family 3 C-terminal domain-containing protein [Lachnospiraceae bacterium]